MSLLCVVQEEDEGGDFGGDQVDSEPLTMSESKPKSTRSVVAQQAPCSGSPATMTSAAAAAALQGDTNVGAVGAPKPKTKRWADIMDEEEEEVGIKSSAAVIAVKKADGKPSTNSPAVSVAPVGAKEIYAANSDEQGSWRRPPSKDMENERGRPRIRESYSFRAARPSSPWRRPNVRESQTPKISNPAGTAVTASGTAVTASGPAVAAKSDRPTKPEQSPAKLALAADSMPANSEKPKSEKPPEKMASKASDIRKTIDVVTAPKEVISHRSPTPESKALVAVTAGHVTSTVAAPTVAAPTVIPSNATHASPTVEAAKPHTKPTHPASQQDAKDVCDGKDVCAANRVPVIPGDNYGLIQTRTVSISLVQLSSEQSPTPITPITPSGNGTPAPITPSGNGASARLNPKARAWTPAPPQLPHVKSASVDVQSNIPQSRLRSRVDQPTSETPTLPHAMQYPVPVLPPLSVQAAHFAQHPQAAQFTQHPLTDTQVRHEAVRVAHPPQAPLPVQTGPSPVQAAPIPVQAAPTPTAAQTAPIPVQTMTAEQIYAYQQYFAAVQHQHYQQYLRYQQYAEYMRYLEHQRLHQHQPQQQQQQQQTSLSTAVGNQTVGNQTPLTAQSAVPFAQTSEANVVTALAESNARISTPAPAGDPADIASPHPGSSLVASTPASTPAATHSCDGSGGYQETKPKETKSVVARSGLEQLEQSVPTAYESLVAAIESAPLVSPAKGEVPAFTGKVQVYALSTNF
jgi:hypothetical protein